MPIRKFLDASVVIAAFKTQREFHEKAFAVLMDEDTDFLSTSLVELELTPCRFNPRDAEEAEFYRTYLDVFVREWLPVDEALIAQGIETSRTTQADALDAMHLTAAIALEADQFISAEHKGKPMYRETRIPVIHVGDA